MSGCELKSDNKNYSFFLSDMMNIVNKLELLSLG